MPTPGEAAAAYLIAKKALEDAGVDVAKDGGQDTGGFGLFKWIASFFRDAPRQAAPLPIVSSDMTWEEYQDEVAKTIKGLHDDLAGSAGGESGTG
jgi:hypothetical protein